MSNDLKIVKKRLLDSDDAIEKILEAIGCESIKYEQGRTLITAQLPQKFHSDNKRAVQCKLNESLHCSIRTKSDFRGDIFSLISYIEHDKRNEDMNKDLFNSKKFICETLGWRDLLRIDGKKTKDYLSPLKNILKGKKKRRKITPNPTMDEKTLDNFIKFPAKCWVDEGISIKTQREFGIGFDLQTKRITIPVRDRFGSLIGVKGRLMLDSDVTDYEPKYKYIYPCNISQEWFNFHRAVESIREKKEVIIVEAEKSAMKLYQNGVYNVLSICSSDITPVQVDILLGLGFDITIVIAYDSDKELDEIKEQAEKIQNRDVFIIYDNLKLLPDKSAPIDIGIDTWNELYAESKFQVCYKD